MPGSSVVSLVVKSSDGLKQPVLTCAYTPFSWPGLNEEIGKDDDVSIVLSNLSLLLSSLIKTCFHDTKSTGNLSDHLKSLGEQSDKQ